MHKEISHGGFQRQLQLQYVCTDETAAQRKQRDVLGRREVLTDESSVLWRAQVMLHAAVTSQHPSVQLRTREGEKKAPTMSLLPLGILPLGGHRGCLPSLPGHSTLKEPKTRKVLTNPAAKRWKRTAEIEAPSSLGRRRIDQDRQALHSSSSAPPYLCSMLFVLPRRSSFLSFTSLISYYLGILRAFFYIKKILCDVFLLWYFH